MAGQVVQFPSNGGTANGYLAIPQKGKGPGVIVIQEWWGLVSHIKDVSDRFAAEGYVARAFTPSAISSSRRSQCVNWSGN